MKFLISDYDLTYDIDIKTNIEKTKEFMKNNLFSIATGRTYQGFKKIEYDIPYNYLIINHGSTILKNDEIFYNVYIDNDIKNEIIKILKSEKIVNIFVSKYKEDTNNLDVENITKIHVTYNDEQTSLKIKNKIIEKFDDFVEIYFGFHSSGYGFEIVSKGVNKANAIEYIANFENIDKKDIYTIGDNYTDIKMIEKYNGNIMKNSVEALKQITNKKYKNVSALIDELME